MNVCENESECVCECVRMRVSVCVPGVSSLPEYPPGVSPSLSSSKQTLPCRDPLLLPSSTGTTVKLVGILPAPHVCVCVVPQNRTQHLCVSHFSPSHDKIPKFLLPCPLSVSLTHTHTWTENTTLTSPSVGEVLTSCDQCFIK